MLKPTNFNAAKNYPLFMTQYSGPGSQSVSNTWNSSNDYWYQHLAEQGYIIVCVDGRGTGFKGAEFKKMTYKELGKYEVQDQIESAKELGKLPYIDENEIGIWGWSYGGFMTVSLMLQHSDVFKVGVAGGPVIDWKYYEVMYGERYMDTPQENPDGYETANLNMQVKGLKGRLMIIDGAVDPVVVWQHSLSFVRSCVENEVQLDYFAYPRHEHNVRGHDRVHLMKKVTQYFEDFL